MNTSKKFAKVGGAFLTDGNLNRIRVTKQQALSVAVRSSKRLGLASHKMKYLVVDAGDHFNVITHTGVAPQF